MSIYIKYPAGGDISPVTVQFSVWLRLTVDSYTFVSENTLNKRQIKGKEDKQQLLTIIQGETETLCFIKKCFNQIQNRF